MPMFSRQITRNLRLRVRSSNKFGPETVASLRQVHGHRKEGGWRTILRIWLPKWGFHSHGGTHLEMDDDWGYPHFRNPPIKKIILIPYRTTMEHRKSAVNRRFNGKSTKSHGCQRINHWVLGPPILKYTQSCKVLGLESRYWWFEVLKLQTHWLHTGILTGKSFRDWGFWVALWFFGDGFGQTILIQNSTANI